MKKRMSFFSAIVLTAMTVMLSACGGTQTQKAGQIAVHKTQERCRAHLTEIRAVRDRTKIPRRSYRLSPRFFRNMTGQKISWGKIPQE